VTVLALAAGLTAGAGLLGRSLGPDDRGPAATTANGAFHNGLHLNGLGLNGTSSKGRHPHGATTGRPGDAPAASNPNDLRLRAVRLPGE
jgi:hypothetical protein